MCSWIVDMWPSTIRETNEIYSKGSNQRSGRVRINKYLSFGIWFSNPMVNPIQKFRTVTVPSETGDNRR